MNDDALSARIDALLDLAASVQGSASSLSRPRAEHRLCRERISELLIKESRAIRACLFARPDADAARLRHVWEPRLNALTTAYYTLLRARSEVERAGALVGDVVREAVEA